VTRTSNWDAWLGSEPASNDDLIAMLIPIAAERLTMWLVSKALGNVKNEGPELVERVGL
jgi:putative SOS response-associated peptidase YedK